MKSTYHWTAQLILMTGIMGIWPGLGWIISLFGLPFHTAVSWATLPALYIIGRGIASMNEDG